MGARGELHILGIRHHGAGSARRMLKALEALQPSAIAIELPADSEMLVKQLSKITHQPPIAFLYYDKKYPEHSIYLPLAAFSPEYQAIKYAAEHQLPLYCIDIPAAAFLRKSNFKEDETNKLSKRMQAITADPIGYLAKHAGYRDAERWWESQFEQWTDHEPLFEVILHLMETLRINSHWQDDRETLVREKFMRCRLREISKAHPDRLAVVCGAWHGPVLTPDYLETTRDEQSPRLKLTDVSTCLIPWTYRSIQLNQFYTAGIKAPSWHECLFKDPASSVSVFLSRAANRLRKEGYEVSTDEVIGANRLANHLGVLRELPLPGLDEIMDAAQTAFHMEGRFKKEWFEDKLFCDEVTGVVPIEQMNLPYVRLFHALLKELRLGTFWKDGGKDELLLDLRKEKHLRISQFLHYCSMCLDRWCHEGPLDWNVQGSFYENWNFQWHPELEMQLIALACKGNSWDEVLLAHVSGKLDKAAGVVEVLSYLDHSLKGGYQRLWSIIAPAMQNALIRELDFGVLSSLLPRLKSIITFGNVHKTETFFVEEVLQQLLIKLIFEMENNSLQLQEPRARTMFECMHNIEHFFKNDPENALAASWRDQVKSIASNNNCHPLLRGKCWNIQSSNKDIEHEQILFAFRREFSTHDQATQAVFWLEGFMDADTTLFLQNPFIIECVDQWMSTLDQEVFIQHLPMLRKCFSNLPVSHRISIFNGFANHNAVQRESSRYVLAEHRRNILMQALRK